MGFRSRYESFDRLQQRHRLLGFLLAVRQKYGDDQGGCLAATIAYDGLFATFPLLLVFTATLGFVLQGHHHLQQTILNSALGQFLVIGHDLKAGALKGNAIALGLGGALARETMRATSSHGMRVRLRRPPRHRREIRCLPLLRSLPRATRLEVESESVSKPRRALRVARTASPASRDGRRSYARCGFDTARGRRCALSPSS